MVVQLYKWLMAGFAWFVLCGALPQTGVDRSDSDHPFFIAVTEVNYNGTEKNLEVSCRIFYDDLESVLKKNYKQVVDLSSEKDKSRSESLIADYLRKHLSIAVNGQALNLRFLGFEKDKEAAWCYLESSEVAVPRKMEFHNTILHDFTTDQINIIHATVNGKRQSTKLNYPAKDAALSF